MEKKTFVLKSEYLSKEIEIKSYGHYGLNLLLFKPNVSDEIVSNLLNESLQHVLNIGKFKLFTVDSIDEESWLDKSIDPVKRSEKHYFYNRFIEEELMQYIYEESGGPAPVITCGASIGAFHAANSFFRRPDLFLGTIALSGIYDIKCMSDGYYDDNCYYNSPIHYLPNLNDTYWLSYLMSRRHIYIASGSGEGESPFYSQQLAKILYDKGIHHHLEIWDNQWDHSPKTWIAMLKYFLENKL
jgi:esterase/lipase superfamily enzyme